MTQFGDPGFKYMTAMGEVWGRMALRLANAEHYPHDFGIYAERVGGFIDALAAQPAVNARLDLSAGLFLQADRAPASSDEEGAA